MSILITEKEFKDRQLALEILHLLNTKANKVDFVLQLICESLILQNEELINKLHIAMAKVTTRLLQHKQSRIDLGIETIPFAYNNSKMSKLTNEARISYMLDICNVAFPNGKLESSSQHSKRIYDDTVAILKAIITIKKITSIKQLFEDDWYKRRGDYITLLANNNDLFGV